MAKTSKRKRGRAPGPHDRQDCPCGHPAGTQGPCAGCNCADDDGVLRLESIVREQAALLCNAYASNWECPALETLDTIGVSLGDDAYRLAHQAAAHTTSIDALTAWAEAEAMLRTGWSPAATES